jgi:hypothetical protein
MNEQESLICLGHPSSEKARRGRLNHSLAEEKVGHRGADVMWWAGYELQAD